MKKTILLLVVFFLLLSVKSVSAVFYPAVTNLKYQCNTAGNQVTLSWSPVSGAVYMLRLNDPSNNAQATIGGWYTPNTTDVIANSLTLTSFTATVIPDRTYQWWINTYDPGTGNWGAVAYGPWFTCKSNTINSGYFLGAIYMNKPATPTHQWSTLEFFNATTDIKGTYRVRLPALGYSNGADPRVLEWQIQSSVEHGLNFFIMNDYWTTRQSTPTYNTNTYAFLRAGNSAKMKFAAAIINNNGPSVDEVKQNFIGNMATFYKNNYFNQTNYLRIEGKPVLYILHSGVLGDWDPTRINAELKAFEATAGTEVYWIFMGAEQTESSLAAISAMGFKAIGPYGLDPIVNEPAGYTGTEYSTIINAVVQSNSWFLANVGKYNLKFIPVASGGHDERPRYAAERYLTIRTYNKNATLDGYKTILTSIKQSVDQYVSQNSPVILKIDGKPILSLLAYNEWHETIALEPGLSEVVTSANQFAVLDAVFQIFGFSGPVPTNQLPDPSIRQPVSSQTSWTADDVNKIYTNPGSTDLVKVSGQNYAKTTIIGGNNQNFQIATNVSDLSQYKGARITFKASCSKPQCFKSLFMSWNTYLPATNEPGFGSAGLGISGCSVGIDGWTTCTIIPTQITAPAPVNPDKFIGKMFQLFFTVFVDDNPVEMLVRNISLVPINETQSPTPIPTAVVQNADLDGNGSVNITDYNIVKADFGKTGTPGFIPSDINKNGKVDIFDYTYLVEKMVISTPTTAPVKTPTPKPEVEPCRNNQC